MHAPKEIAKQRLSAKIPQKVMPKGVVKASQGAMSGHPGARPQEPTIRELSPATRLLRGHMQMSAMPQHGAPDARSPPRPRQGGENAKHLSQREQLSMLHKQRSDTEIDTGLGQHASQAGYPVHSRFSAPPTQPLQAQPGAARVTVNQSSVKLPGQTFGQYSRQAPPHMPLRGEGTITMVNQGDPSAPLSRAPYSGPQRQRGHMFHYGEEVKGAGATQDAKLKHPLLSKDQSGAKKRPSAIEPAGREGRRGDGEPTTGPQRRSESYLGRFNRFLGFS